MVGSKITRQGKFNGTLRGASRRESTSLSTFLSRALHLDLFRCFISPKNVILNVKKMLVNFYFSQSLVSSSEYMQRTMVIFLSVLFSSPLSLSQRYFVIPGKVCLIQPNSIFLVSYIWCEHE